MRKKTSAERDVVDLHFREALAMALLFRVVLAALHLEDDDLVALAVSHDLAGHFRAGNERNAGVHVGSIGAKEHFLERHRRANLGVERWQAKRFPRLGAELKAGGANDGVGHGDDTVWSG